MAKSKPATDETDDRTYFKIEPAADATNPAHLEDAFQRLHTYQRPLQLECLIIARGDSVDYYLGTETENMRTVDHTLHSVFPDETTISHPDTKPPAILEALIPDTDQQDDSTHDVGNETSDGLPAQPQESAAADRPSAAAIRYVGWSERRDDWQMQLQAAADVERDIVESPLAGIVDTLSDRPDDTTVVYQAILEPYEDWSVKRGLREESLKWNEDTPAQYIGKFLFNDYEKPDPEDLGRPHKERLEELDAADPKNSWAVNVRVYVQGPNPDALVFDLKDAFSGINGDYYKVRPQTAEGDDARAVLEAIKDRILEIDHGFAKRLGKRLPGYPNTKPAVITDPASAPAFCILDGGSLTQTGQQALDTTPGERSGVTPPTDEQLDLYETTGLTLGRLLNEDDERTDTNIALPPDLQPLHVAWFGKTGAGKTVGAQRGAFDNHDATDGPAIILDTKGDGMGEDFLKAYYWEYGDLEDVYYFECDRFVPAISFFDISDEIEAGVPRATAIEDTVDHYIELLQGIMGEKEFESKRAEDVIRYLLKAMYDPVHGSDAFAHSEFSATVQRMADRQEPPAVTDPTLERKLAGIAADRSDVFAGVMQGVAGRIEKATRDSRLARLFEHVPPQETDDDDDPDATDDRSSFDFADHINEDSVIVIDTGGLREAAQREMVLVILSSLWAALRNRDRRRREDPSFNTDLEPDPPLVNLYVEEAADVADTSLMNNLLSKSRSFGLSVTLAMQFPAQLRETAPRTYHEVLNNVSTIVTGNVGRDRPLAERLATDDMNPSDVANRLRGLRRGQWLAKLPAEFLEDEPRPFLLESADPPAGHPASDEPLSPARYTAFDAALYSCKERTREQAGLTVAQTSVVDDTANEAPTSTSGEADPTDNDDLRPRVDTTLPYTKRMPDHLEYDVDRHALTCTGCGAVYDPDRVGLESALECCPDGEIDPDDIPIFEVNLKLTPEERRECDYSDGQLMFLQAVYNAAQLRYEAPMYDLLSDSMLRLREYVGIDADAVDELLDDGLLRHDADHPHRLYTVSADGRALIGERHRHGVAHGHGKGDLGESSQHAMGVETVRRWSEQEFEANPDSEVATVIPYYELEETDIEADIDLDESGNASRLDLVGLDEDDDIVLTIEVERINHDVAEAVPADYDKMAACDPEEAIWIVMTQSAGHDVLQALNDSGRVEKTYAETTPPQQFRIDEPGLTEMYPVEWIQDRLE